MANIYNIAHFGCFFFAFFGGLLNQFNTQYLTFWSPKCFVIVSIYLFERNWCGVICHILRVFHGSRSTLFVFFQHRVARLLSGAKRPDTYHRPQVGHFRSRSAMYTPTGHRSAYFPRRGALINMPTGWKKEEKK